MVSFSLSFEGTNSGDCCTLLKVLLLDCGWMGTTALTIIIIPSHNTKTILFDAAMLLEDLMRSSLMHSFSKTLHTTLSHANSHDTLYSKGKVNHLSCGANKVVVAVRC